ncbi:MAG: hypothetical protein J6B37_08365 [Clostridia bacterium]|nr:hypothetical protein [Clostridia bacterium]
MTEIKDYIVYPDNIEIYVPPTMPAKQNKFYKNLAFSICWLVSKFAIRAGSTIEKVNMDGLKPPYIVLSNHTQFADFIVSFRATRPYNFNNIATLDGFVGMAKIMEKLGCACHRKFTTDISLIRAVHKVLHDYGDILYMYPEARYTNVGTTAIIPDVVAKLVKKNKVPLVTMIHNGNYLNAPFWDFRQYRKVPFKATMKQVLTAEQVQEMSVEEINEVIQREMSYDDYKWQKENNIRITEDFRADGLNKILYKCPHCMTEGKMVGKGTHLSCEECGKVWEMTELGEMKALEGETEFSHIPDWYEWEREKVRQELLDGTYKYEDNVHIYSLPGVEFIDLGEGKVTHDLENGFIVTGHYNGHDYRIQRTTKSLFTLHMEFAYKKLNMSDNFDVSVKDDSLYCIPSQKDVVTKLMLATEEAYKIVKEKSAK